MRSRNSGCTFGLFQSTFPRGERQDSAESKLWANKFQSTFPRGERLGLSYDFVMWNGFQSTFPRGERQQGVIRLIKWEIVSIHVPARGTTRPGVHLHVIRRCFNPRSREGNDGMSEEEALEMMVSIHVPARGTTNMFCIKSIRLPSFNPRSREGND